MHSRNVAHRCVVFSITLNGNLRRSRDISDLNIMLAGDSLYPDGFHPSLQNFTPSIETLARAKRRCDVQSVKYYFIDFELSTRFESNDGSKLVVGTSAAVRDIPELSYTVPYDPFAVDIYALGTVYGELFSVRSLVWLDCFELIRQMPDILKSLLFETIIVGHD